MHRFRPIPSAICLTLLLGSCAGTDSLRLTRLWGADRPNTAAAAGAPPTQYYCYRNIGKVDCYVAPDAQRRQ